MSLFLLIHGFDSSLSTKKIIRMKIGYKIFLNFLVCACACECVCLYVYVCACVLGIWSSRKTYEGQFSPYTIWILGINQTAVIKDTTQFYRNCFLKCSQSS